MAQGRVRFGIRARLILMIGLLITLLVLGISIFYYYNAKNMVENGIFREAQLTAETNAQAVSQWFKAIEDEMYLFSIIPEVRSFELDKARAIMNELIQERPEYGGILLADTTGTATTVEGLTINIALGIISFRRWLLGRFSTPSPLLHREPMSRLLCWPGPFLTKAVAIR